MAKHHCFISGVLVGVFAYWLWQRSHQGHNAGGSF